MADYKPTEDLVTLKSTYDMYEKTIKETKRKMKERLNSDGTRMYDDEKIKANVELMVNAQHEIADRYVSAGGDIADLGIKKSRVVKKDKAQTDANEAYLAMLSEANAEREKENNYLSENIRQTAESVERSIPDMGDYDPNSSFDVIPLPSKGEGYKSKRATMPVAYLTAYDEDMIVSPNLYRDNQVLDYIIRAKVKNNEIDPADLLEGDRDAIVLFLRSTGYGSDYPITATDDRTGTQFDAVVDLSKLKYKEFNLKGDANGWFDYTLPISKAVVKFRFPTHKDIVTLKKLEEIEDFKLRKEKLNDMADTMDLYIDKETQLSAEKKTVVRQAINEIHKWSDDVNEDDTMRFNHPITNRFNLLIMSVNDITDRKYIMNFIRNMSAKDSLALRKYMSNNEPGIDYNIEVQRPESLGGGSMKVFLQLDQLIFLNIAE